MRIEITTDPAEFRSRTETFLRRDPLRHTVITTGTANSAGGLDGSNEPSRFLSAHAEDGTVLGVAMRSAGRDLYLGELADSCVDAVAEALAEIAPDAGGVEGAIETATRFGDRWSAMRGGGYRHAYTMRLYRLRTLRFPEAAGSPRRAVESDIELCLAWSEAMLVESGMSPQGWTATLVGKRIAAGRWWLWEHEGGPVSLAAHQAPVYGWSRIGPVYTPPAERGHGYAGILTAHVAHTLRTEGIDVCLFADIDNPTANKIYRAIGFESAGEFVHYAFT
ncbi:GNAT family N-acetyltransferase [Nocardia sp. NBC_01009]|uniref:GNAT family N-acetyltransferase n=1 Tax=Nocardia sp. NBC_01009 TaxID=2975996 RepID=UPI00386820D9|nr:GNAT family N-acetyltransferase [Nocardia sp. NBC_01009]